MNESPLKLERYFFTRIVVEASSAPGAKGSNEVETTVELAQGVEDQRRYQVVVRLKLLPPKGAAATYTGEVDAVGFFRVVDTWPKERAKQLVETNGAALLYGAIREMITNLTARGPWPALTMPSVSFLRPDATKPPAPTSSKAGRKMSAKTARK